MTTQDVRIPYGKNDPTRINSLVDGEFSYVKSKLSKETKDFSIKFIGKNHEKMIIWILYFMKKIRGFEERIGNLTKSDSALR
jgi:hypothetical protein